jgi:probable rRNA maturation factor
MKPEVLVADHQTREPVTSTSLAWLEASGSRACARILDEQLVLPGASLPHCESLEVALVDDAESERVHLDFMGIPGPTDVITFDHGEIVISIPVAQRQAREFGEPPMREILRYIVHGLLHLAGYTDGEDAERRRMEGHQERLVAALWKDLPAPDDP